MVVLEGLALAVAGPPDADSVIIGTAGEHRSVRIPGDLFDVVFVSAPDLLGTVRLFNAPEIDVLGNACDCDAHLVLPFDFQTFEGRVQLAVVKLRDVFALDDIPDGNPARFKTGRGDEVCRAFIELGVHQHHIKIFDVLDFNLRSVTDIKLPDACDHVTAARDEPVALTIPMDGTHIGSDLCKLRAPDVWQ